LAEWDFSLGLLKWCWRCYKTNTAKPSVVVPNLEGSDGDLPLAFADCAATNQFNRVGPSGPSGIDQDLFVQFTGLKQASSAAPKLSRFISDMVPTPDAGGTYGPFAVVSLNSPKPYSSHSMRHGPPESMEALGVPPALCGAVLGHAASASSEGSPSGYDPYHKITGAMVVQGKLAPCLPPASHLS
jgi:hypothetical protein